ncbi:MAG TPA: hypothetical protein PKL87_10430 [Thermotogota bacterium]|nr:hypothetical protein [Thermotogota bacterium]HOD92085.1 hypothetical protein [Thermotogota bacterium]
MNLLALVGCHKDISPRELFVGNKIAFFPTNWEQHLRAEISEMEALSEEARTALRLERRSGKPLIARYIARKLTSSNPSFVPKSLKEIINKAISVSWEEACVIDSRKV